jgi:NAD+ kinase
MTFETIGLFGRQRYQPLSDTLTAVKDFLLSRQLEVIVEEETAKLMSPQPLTVYAREKMASVCDLFIVVGGDGSLLTAAHSAVHHGISVLGINRGRLGFLADIKPQELEQKIGEVLDGKYLEEERFFLSAEIIQQGVVISNGMALNDIVLTSAQAAHMIDFYVMTRDQLVYSERADGLITATPTGSTAYALSGGGPILYPQLNAVVLVPMFSHTLTARPIVLNADNPLRIRFTEKNTAEAWLNCDGQTRFCVPLGCDIYITKKPEKLKLIHPLDYDYFETLRTKLNWHTFSYQKEK